MATRDRDISDNENEGPPRKKIRGEVITIDSSDEEVVVEIETDDENERANTFVFYTL